MTRKILSLVLSIVALSCMAAKAENEEQPKYAHFIDTDKVWEYGYAYDGNSYNYPRYLHQYIFDGIEEHQGRTYHVLWETQITTWNPWTDNNDIPTTRQTMRKIALLREENEKIYMLYKSDTPILIQEEITDLYNIPNYDDKEFINPLRIITPDATVSGVSEVKEGEELVLFDFNKKIESTIDVWGFGIHWEYNFTPALFRHTVEDISEISLNENSEEYLIKSIQSYYFPPTPDDNDISYLKNIYVYNSYVGAVGYQPEGNSTTILGPAIYMVPIIGANFHFWFNNLYDKEGKVLYAGTNVQPPAHDGVAEIGAEAAAKDMRMFDLMGREISNPLPGTVYIQNGRKLIAR